MILTAFDHDSWCAAVIADLKQEGLKKTVQYRLNEINELVKGLSYLDHRMIQQLLSETLEIIEIYLKEVANNERSA